MSDGKQSWSRIGLGLAAYAAVAALFIASAIANFRYGLSLAQDPIDRAAYGAASFAVDVLKASLPMLGVLLWRRQHRVIASASVLLWLGCVAWSLSSAIGFALTTRAEANVGRAQEHAEKAGWTATVTRVEEQLSTLGRARPSAVVRADLSAVTVPTLIWQRSRQCNDLATLEKQRACARVTALRRELVAAQAAERLEGTLTEARTASADISHADPQATALARVTGLPEGDVRTGLALLLAGIIELASAMGFAIVGLAMAPQPRLRPEKPEPHPLKEAAIADTRRGPASFIKAHPNLQASSKIATERSAPIGRATHLKVQAPAKTSELLKDVEAFLQAQMLSIEEGRVGSTILHEAFNRYCRSHGFPERSQQALGRQLSRLGTSKVRCTRTGRVEYAGLALKDQQRSSASSDHRTLMEFPSSPKVQATADNPRVKDAVGRNVPEGPRFSGRNAKHS